MEEFWCEGGEGRRNVGIMGGSHRVRKGGRSEGRKEEMKPDFPHFLISFWLFAFVASIILLLFFNSLSPTEIKVLIQRKFFQYFLFFLHSFSFLCLTFTVGCESDMCDSAWMMLVFSCLLFFVFRCDGAQQTEQLLDLFSLQAVR